MANILFHSGNEKNDLTEWSVSSVGGAGTLTSSATAAWFGNYGYRMTVGTGLDDAQLNTPALSSTTSKFSVSWRFQIAGSGLGAASVVDFSGATDTSQTYGLSIRYAAGTWSLRVTGRDGTTHLTSLAKQDFTTGTWYHVEVLIDWTVTTQQVFTVWVDGLQVAQYTDATTGTNVVYTTLYPDLWVIISTGLTGTTTVYYDELCAADDRLGLGIAHLPSGDAAAGFSGLWTSSTQTYTDNNPPANATSATAAPGRNATFGEDFQFGAFTEVPAGSTVTAVRSAVKYAMSATGVIGEALGFQVMNGGVAVSTETVVTNTTAYTFVEKFDSAGLPTAADVNISNQVAVRVRASRGATNTSYTANLDVVLLAVYYIPPPPATAAVRDSVARFGLQSAAVARDLTIRWNLASPITRRDLALRAGLASIAVWRNTAGRLALRSAAWRDLASRFNLQAAVTATWRNTALRARLRSAVLWRDLVGRLRLQSSAVWRDQATRAQLRSAVAWRDHATRLRSLAQVVRDTASRSRLRSPATWRDAISRSRLQAPSWRDQALRFGLSITATAAVRDVASRLRLLVIGFRDTAARVAVRSVVVYRDFVGRARLASAAVYRDAAGRLRLVAGLFRDESTRVRLGAAVVRDLAARLQLAAVQLRDAVLRFALRPGQAVRPTGDVSIGGWTTDAGLTTGLYARVNEVLRNDATYVQSAAGPVNDTLILAANPATDPGVNDGYRLSLAYEVSTAGASVDVTVTVQAGTVDVASRTFNAIPAGWTESAVLLTPTEVQAFRANGGFANPRFKIVANQVA